jgi:lipid-A-disaccharide synthase
VRESSLTPDFPILVIAGEPSGDTLAAELIEELRRAWPTGSSPRFFGAGGERMANAGAELISDLASHAVVGLVEVLKNYRRFKKIFDNLLAEAIARRPELIILVDFSGFNRRFAAAIRERAQRQNGGWSPKLVYFVSPQVWASRPSRAKTLERDLDLLLSIFPFEKAWYAQRAPKLRVEYVGHPLTSRYASYAQRIAARPAVREPARAVLLPGSRLGELKRHLPVMLDAARKISETFTTRWTMVLPNERLQELAAALVADSGLEIITLSGGLPETLLKADLALASTGTVTMECAYFLVPTVALYKTSWSTYQIGKRIIEVPYLAMPNLLMNEAVFPEFVQHQATSANIAAAGLSLLQSETKRGELFGKLLNLRDALGPAGATSRAAQAILALLPRPV